MAKIGRNSLCPCGSGKKYKKCCLKQENHIKNFAEKIKKRYPELSKNFIQAKDHHIKMSEIIIDLADELLEVAESMKDKKGAITITIIAWNLSLLDEETCNQELLTMSKTNAIKNYDGHKEMVALLKSLINKKNVEYPDINRFIVDYEFIKLNKDDFHLNVVSVIHPEELGIIEDGV